MITWEFYTLPLPCEGSILLWQACWVYIGINSQWYLLGQLNDSNVILKICRIEMWMYIYIRNDIILVTVRFYVPCNVPFSKPYLHTWTVPVGKRHTCVEIKTVPWKHKTVTSWSQRLEKCWKLHWFYRLLYGWCKTKTMPLNMAPFTQTYALLLQSMKWMYCLSPQSGRWPIVGKSQKRQTAPLASKLGAHTICLQ